MLRIFRSRKTVIRLFVGTILVLVALSMVIYLIPGFTGLSDDPTISETVAEVAGEKIRAFELQQTVTQISQANRIPSEMMGLYTSQVLNDMILEKVSLREARRLGLQVAESELATRLRQIPDLFPGGKFVGQQQYEDMIFGRFGMGVAQFEQRYRHALLIEKLRALVTDTVAVTPEEVRTAFQNDNEKLVVSYAFADPTELKKEITPNDATLEAYYQKNKSRYQVPEKRSVKILWLEQQRIRSAISIPESEIKKYYEDRKDNYRKEERVQVSHILWKATDKEPDKLAEAKKKAEDLLKKLKGGADFAQLAKENSEDTATAVGGGDLGWIVRKQTVPEFEKAAFSLAPGTLSDPVQTVFGIHILKVVAHEQARLQPLEEVKLEILNLLQEERVQATLPGQAEEVAAAVRRAPSEIEALTQKYHGIFLPTGPLAQQDLVPGLGQAPGFQQEVFSLQKGQVGAAVPVPSGYAIPLLADILPAHQGEFAEVKDQVKSDYVDELAREKASTKSKELAKLLEQQAKKDLAKAAKGLGLTVKASDPVTREAPIPLLGKLTELDPKAFSRQVGEVAGPFSVGSGQVIYHVDLRLAPQEEDFAKQKDQIQERLLNQKRQLTFSVFQDDLKRKLEASGDLRVHRDVLTRLTQTYRPSS